jgi:hypothetical protein
MDGYCFLGCVAGEKKGTLNSDSCLVFIAIGSLGVDSPPKDCRGLDWDAELTVRVRVRPNGTPAVAMAWPVTMIQRLLHDTQQKAKVPRNLLVREELTGWWCDTGHAHVCKRSSEPIVSEDERKINPPQTHCVADMTNHMRQTYALRRE